MSYLDTFVQVAPDTQATEASVPVSRRAAKPIHIIQYELLTENPYRYTHDDLVYEVHIRRQGFSAAELAANGAEIRAELLSKGHPCMRASALTKKFGWGAHYDEQGRIALYPVGSEEYEHFLKNSARVLTAFKTKR